MNHEPDKHLEQLLHQQLRELPLVAAPADLIPRVHAAIAARQHRPWWQQPWLAWALAMRMVSAVLLFIGLGAVGWVGARLLPVLAGELGAPAQSGSAWTRMWEAGTTAANTVLAWLNLNLGGQNLLLIGLTVLVIMYLSCIGLGTLCFRLAYNKR